MNRFISVIAGTLIALILTFVAGYWDSRGVVPVGDMRVPSQFVGGSILVFASIASAALGGTVSWTSVVGGIRAYFPTASCKGKKSCKEQTATLPMPMPIQAENLQVCIFHLREALAKDASSQSMLDRIQVKVSRVSAKSSAQNRGG